MDQVCHGTMWVRKGQGQTSIEVKGGAFPQNRKSEGSYQNKGKWYYMAENLHKHKKQKLCPIEEAPEIEFWVSRKEWWMNDVCLD